ncbi:MAG: hypothetical protein HDQ87_05425 [Clostridia bacterium]|nr:hypothetical protein [Clostridia bacterium]
MINTTQKNIRNMIAYGRAEEIKAYDACLHSRIRQVAQVPSFDGIVAALFESEDGELYAIPERSELLVQYA